MRLLLRSFFHENNFCVAFFHIAQPLIDTFTAVDLYMFLCTNGTKGTGTPSVPKYKTIFGYQTIITYTFSRCPPEYIRIVPQKALIL